jgi:hypothetical protein
MATPDEIQIIAANNNNTVFTLDIIFSLQNSQARAIWAG